METLLQQQQNSESHLKLSCSTSRIQQLSNSAISAVCYLISAIFERGGGGGGGRGGGGGGGGAPQKADVLGIDEARGAPPLPRSPYLGRSTPNAADTA
ncbi:hypothetical protein K0M31_015083, partial [Melipona bicolor]